MQSQTPKRRTHEAQFKAAVMAACREPGASVAAVAQTHGLNANLVRKWMVGRGVKRCAVQPPAAAALCTPTLAMQFVPVQLPAPPAQAQAYSACSAREAIEIELTRAGASLSVRWPAAQAAACAGWLGELAAALAR